MATLVCTLTQRFPAVVGRPTWFNLAVKNNGASATNIRAVDPVVTSAAGQVGVPYNLGGPYASPSQNTPSVTYPFNQQITAGATANFQFSIAMFGPQVAGAPATPFMQFQVLASVLDSDGVITQSPPIDVALNQPGFGQPPGSPPNPAIAIGSLVFQAPANSPLSPVGL